MAGKKIVDARADSKGNITAVKLKGNKSFAPIDTAIEMAKRKQIEGAHVSRTGSGKPYLRTNPDGKKGNNLDEMAGDT